MMDVSRVEHIKIYEKYLSPEDLANGSAFCVLQTMKTIAVTVFSRKPF